ncbi:MAG: DUF6364 family protein [Marinoscillum sp.]
MNTKLTLSMDEEVVKKAKKYARENGRSLSGLIESYLIGITSEHIESDKKSTPVTNKLQGAFKVDEPVSLSDSITKKYRKADD